MTPLADPRTTTLPAGGQRQDILPWVDGARGAAIVLVVLGHCWRGLHETGLISSDPLFQTVDRLIYTFHMPVFFLLSGWLFPRALARHDPVSFALGRVMRLVYPLVLWTYIFAIVKAMAGQAINSPLSWTEILRLPLPPQWHFWFLWALFLIQIAVLPLRPWLLPGSAERQVLCWLALAGMGLLLHHTISGGPWFYGALWGAPFFFLGAALGRLDWPAFPARIGLAALGIFLAAEALALILPPGSPWRLATTLGAALAFCAILKTVLDLWPDQTGWLRVLGQASMAIFLMHTIISAAVRVGLLQAGLRDPGLHLALGTMAGIVVPLAFWTMTRRRGIARALGF